MDKITLYRKGGRKPWVFEWCETDEQYRYTSKYGNCYQIFIQSLYNIKPIWIGRFSGKGKFYHAYWYTVETMIRADHFKLGNVTITF